MGNHGVFVGQCLRMNVRVAVALVVAIVLLALSHASIASAQNTANTLRVSPVRTDIDIKPGETKTVQTVITNLTDAPITVHPSTNDFVAGDERGTPALILDETMFAPTHSLKRFMGPLENVTIPARQAKTINVVISVPASAQAGGYFGAVRFEPTSPDGGGQVNLSPSVASIILVTVPGDIVEKLSLTDFTIQQKGINGSIFNTGDNIAASVRFENKGGSQMGPFGKLSVKKGDKVVHEVDFNDKTPRDMILPDSARRWDIPLSNVSGFGYYEVVGTFTYGQTNQSIEVTQSFWVIPWSVVVGTIIAFVLLAALIVSIVLFVRRSKRRGRITLGSRGRGPYRRR